MPRLWNDTIEAHRRDVGEAILDAAGALVVKHGLHAITMSRVAEQAGIGRATLYKYFADIEAILIAWHDRQIRIHLDRVRAARERADDAGDALEAVLHAYALVRRESTAHDHGADVTALFHRGKHIERAYRELHHLIADAIAQAAQAGKARGDVPADELAAYCLHALSAVRAASLPQAVRRLVGVTLAGLRPDANSGGRAGTGGRGGTRRG